MYSIRRSINGKPDGEIIAQSDRLDDIIHHWRAGELLVVWNQPPVEIKRISPEALARRRALSHNRRVEKQVPLFAQLYTVPVPPKTTQA